MKCRAVQIGALAFSTLAVGTCTVLIACFVAYVIATRKRAQISFAVIVALVVIPSAIYASVLAHYYYVDELEDRKVVNGDDGDATFYAMNQGHDYLRLTQVLLNVLAVGVIIYTLKKMSRNGQYNLCTCRRSKTDAKIKAREEVAAKAGLRPSESQLRNTAAHAGAATDQYPMFVLARRLIWYPVIGSLGALASFQYHFYFSGQALDEYPGTVVTNPLWWWQTIQMFLYAFVMPMNGPLYAGVFFYVHTGAWTECKVTLWWVHEWVRHCGAVPEDIKKAIADASVVVEVEVNSGSGRRKSMVMRRKTLQKIETKKRLASINGTNSLEAASSNSPEYSDDNGLYFSDSDDSLENWDEGVVEMSDYRYSDDEVMHSDSEGEDEQVANDAGAHEAGGNEDGSGGADQDQMSPLPGGEGAAEKRRSGRRESKRSQSLRRQGSVRVLGGDSASTYSGSGSNTGSDSNSVNVNPAEPGDNPIHSF